MDRFAINSLFRSGKQLLFVVGIGTFTTGYICGHTCPFYKVWNVHLDRKVQEWINEK